jgi:hypothetical protein
MGNRFMLRVFKKGGEEIVNQNLQRNRILTVS